MRVGTDRKPAEPVEDCSGPECYLVCAIMPSPKCICQMLARTSTASCSRRGRLRATVRIERRTGDGPPLVRMSSVSRLLLEVKQTVASPGDDASRPSVTSTEERHHEYCGKTPCEAVRKGHGRPVAVDTGMHLRRTGRTSLPNFGVDVNTLKICERRSVDMEKLVGSQVSRASAAHRCATAPRTTLPRRLEVRTSVPNGSCSIITTT